MFCTFPGHFAPFRVPILSLLSATMLQRGLARVEMKLNAMDIFSHSFSATISYKKFFYSALRQVPKLIIVY